MGDVLQPNLPGTHDPLNDNDSDVWNRYLEGLAIGAESDRHRPGRHPLRDHRTEQCRRATSGAGEDRFERPALLVASAAVDIDRQRASTLRHRARRGKRVYGIEARNIGLAVTALAYVKREHD